MKFSIMLLRDINHNSLYVAKGCLVNKIASKVLRRDDDDDDNWLTCSYSSVIAFGSSCLWNHIMYRMWKRQDFCFKAFAAKYCAFVP